MFYSIRIQAILQKSHRPQIAAISIWFFMVFSGLIQAQEPKTADVQNADKRSAEASKADDVLAAMEAKIKKQQEEIELLKLFARSLAEIEQNYVQPVDRRRLIEAAIDGMLHDLDQYSDFIPANEVDAFQSDIESEYGGIGIRVVKKPDEEYITVVTPILGSPSYVAGVKSDWWIVRIGNVEMKGASVAKAISQIKGAVGTDLKMTFRDRIADEDIELTIKRSIVRVKTVLGDTRLENDQWNYFLNQPEEAKSKKIGYVRISNFGRQTSTELRSVIDDLQANGMQGLILDLRFNPGGLLSSAIEVSDLFLEKGLIVSVQGRNNRPRQYKAKRENTIGNFPMVVLINSNSASASEIVAASLKDSNRALIAGERSFGKGSVQNLVELDGGKALLKLTTAAYIRPNGQNINRQKDDGPDGEWGVKPSSGLEVKMDEETKDRYFEYRRNRDIIGSKDRDGDSFEDRQLNRAIESLNQSVEATEK